MTLSCAHRNRSSARTSDPCLFSTGRAGGAAAKDLEDDELEDFEEYREPDQLKPLNEAALHKLLKQFPGLPKAVQQFLTRFGVGTINFPDHYGDHEPPSYRIFTLKEARERVTSIREQATFELEQIDPEIGCDVHGDTTDQCRALLTPVRDDPWRFYPFLGTEEHNFVYVHLAEAKRGVVARWYHDYPVCELLDGTGETESFDAYGEELIGMITSKRNPL